MPNSKSAVKRTRQNEKKRIRNRAVKTRVRNTIRAVRESVEQKVGDDAEAKLNEAVRLIDKARSKGVLHKNNAARKISRLTKRVQAKAKSKTA